MNTKFKQLITLSLSALVFACATPYQPDPTGGIFGTSGGYKNHKMQGKGASHWVEFRGNGNTSLEQSTAYWHRRAAEICGHKKYDVELFETLEQPSPVWSPAPSSQYSEPDVRGVVNCRPPDLAWRQ